MTIINGDEGMVETTRTEPIQARLESDPAWSPECNPAVADLLDHIAEVLAVEYVRLMERAAQDSGSDS